MATLDPTRAPSGFRKVRLQVLLVTAINALVLIGALVATLPQVSNFHRHSEDEAVRVLSASAETVLARADALFRPARDLIDHIRDMPLARIAGPGDPDRARQFSYFLNAVNVALSMNDQIGAVYSGYPDGSFALTSKATETMRRMAGVPEGVEPHRLWFERDAALGTPVDRWSWRADSDIRSVRRLSIEFDPRDRPWYRLGRTAAAPAWTDAYRSADDGRFSITLASGLRDGEGRLAAVAGVSINLDDLIAVLDTLDIGDNGFAFLARSDGALIAHERLHSATVATGQDADALTIRNLARADGIDLHLFEAFAKADGRQIRFTHEGRTIMGIRLPLEERLGLDANLFVGAPLSDFTAGAREALWSALVLTAGTTLVVLLAGVVIARAIARPVNRLARAATAVRDGRLDAIGALPPSRLVELDEATRTFNGMVVGLRERETIRSLFGRYVPEQIAAAILDEEGDLTPQTHTATILFVDLEGFTALSESLAPTTIVHILNAYFSRMVSILEKHGGVATQFQGDAILATFNVPVADPGHASNAIAAAREIVETIDAETFLGRRLSCRIGINTGEVVAGAVGAAGRLSYTVHGDAVNLAARLEQMNKDHGTRILLTDATVGAADDALEPPVRPVATVGVRGKRGPVALYTVDAGDTTPVTAELAEPHPPALARRQAEN